MGFVVIKRVIKSTVAIRIILGEGLSHNRH